MLRKIIYVIGLLLPTLLMGQISKKHLPADLLNKAWSAQWIAVSGAAPGEYGVYHFRKSIELPVKPDSFMVHVSADNRYKLFVNGTLVCWGPARGDVYHWNFETLDLAPYLKEGENILAAQVWNYGAHAPMVQQSLQTGFILQGNGEAERIADTGGSWKGWQNGAYAPLPAELHTYFVIDPGEKVDLNLFPWGWEQADFDDSTWQGSREISPGLAYGLFEPWYEGWMLRPRQIPLMEMKPQRIAHCEEQKVLSLQPPFRRKKEPLQFRPTPKLLFCWIRLS